jgi:hypothetical protein
MPGKHVRFSETNIVYSPLPQSPSPIHDTSSLPSWSPHAPKHALVSTPFPSVAFVSLVPEAIVQLHPFLQFTLSPAIDYDISFSPKTIATPHPYALAQPAIHPPLAHLAVVCSDLPWQITVVPSSTIHGAFVTVADVLASLHRTLRLAVHPDEYNALPSHEDKHKVNTAYESRCVRIEDPAAQAEEKRKGVKRVDFLMGRTRFLGLSPTTAGPAVWALRLS